MTYEFKTERRVEFAETDMAGILHFSNYFRYMEAAEHAFFRSLGLRVHANDESGVWGWARGHAECTFKRPLRNEEVVELHVLVREKRERSISYTVVFRKVMKDGDQQVAPVADWQTKRRWVDQAFRELEADGYRVGSAYTAVKGDDVRFLYRDGLWHGADMLGIGVASFSHLGGIHFQNEHDLEPYLGKVEGGELPIHRALQLSPDERLIREFVLQLKLGQVDAGYFRDKFGVDVRERFRAPLGAHARAGFMEIDGDRIVVSRKGLMQIDRLLHDFFLDEHRGARYA